MVSHSNCHRSCNHILKLMHLWPYNDNYVNILPSAERDWSLWSIFHSMFILNVILLDWVQHFRVFYKKGKICNFPIIICSEHFHSFLFIKNFLTLHKNKWTKIYCSILLKNICVPFSVLITGKKNYTAASLLIIFLFEFSSLF